MSARVIAFTSSAWLALAMGGCVLPSFERAEAAAPGADAGDRDGGDADGGGASPGCGLSAELPEACDACIREHCCDLANECGEGTACGADLLEPITPAGDFSTDFDPLLACMQRNCDAACEVSWGCVDDYTWPDVDEAIEVPIRVVDFAASPQLPIEDMAVQACQSVDPDCGTGRVDEGVTDADGMTTLEIQPSFNGFFSFAGADYVDSTVHWNEPIYRVTGFTHYVIQPIALQGLALITGVHTSADEPFDPEAGHLIFRIQSCLPMRYLSVDEPPMAEVGGVSVSFEPDDGASQVFYTEESGGVSVTLEATTSDGLGGAFEAPARNVTVTAVDMASGEEVARGTIRIRKGAIGYTYLLPNSQR